MNSLDEEVRQLLHEGKKVEAVLLIHKSKGCTLLEAKKYIDKLKDDDCNWKNPTKTAVGTSNIKTESLNTLLLRMPQGHILPHPAVPNGQLS